MSDGAERNFRRRTQRAVKKEREACAKIARHRQKICDDAADKYRISHPDDMYWEGSERCAMQEARHIAEQIEGRGRHEEPPK